MLVLATAFTCVLIALAVGLFFILQMLSGGRQLTSATDAGCLNVARVAVLAPTVNLSDPKNPAVVNYPDECQAAQLVIGKGNNVNLLNFNKIVLWGITVAANAEADGGDTALANAKKVWMAIEGDRANSIGAQLKATLQDPTSSIVVPAGTKTDVPTGPNWSEKCFDAVAQSNSIAFANAKDQIEWQSMSTAYLGAGDSSNVVASAVTSLAPFKNHVTGEKSNLPDIPSVAGSDGVSYVQGYVAINFDKVGKYYFVTVYQDQNPSLRTDQDFKAAQAAGVPGAADVSLPPNTFLCTAQVTDSRSKAPISAGTPACVGTKAYPPVGLVTANYISIENGTTLNFHGNLPLLDNVTAQELSTGISAVALPKGGALFSNNGALESWLDYNNKGGKGTPPSLDGLFDEKGQPATDKEARQAVGDATTCNDYNSDGPTSCALCRGLLEDKVSSTPLGAPLGAFDTAYYGENAAYGLASSAPNLTADEFAAVTCASGYSSEYDQQKLANIYKTGLDPDNPWTSGAGDAYVMNISAQNSGMRLFNPTYNAMLGGSVPYIMPGDGFGGHWGGCPQAVLDIGHQYSNPVYFGVVTRPGSIRELVQQNTTGIPSATGNVYGTTTAASSGVPYKRNGQDVKDSPAKGQQPIDEIERMLSSRLKQIKPSVTQDEIDTVLDAAIPPGFKYFIYANQDTGKLTVTTTPPPGYNSALKPDGTPVTFSTSFSLITPKANACGTMINAEYYCGLHEAMFMQTDSSVPEYDGTHSITYNAGSGHDACLGSITFQDSIPKVSTPPPKFWSRD